MRTCVHAVTMNGLCPDARALQTGVPPVPLSWVEEPQQFSSLRLADGYGKRGGSWLRVVHPSKLPWKWGTLELLEMAAAVAWKLTFQDNYGHLLGEHGPTLHNLLCTYMSRSTSDLILEYPSSKRSIAYGTSRRFWAILIALIGTNPLKATLPSRC